MNTSTRRTVASVMSRPLATIDHTATVREAAEALTAGSVGVLVVLHGTGLVGVISERDIVAHVALGADLDHLSVGEVMQTDVITTPAESSVYDAAQAMVGADVRHLPVRDGDRVAGMLSVRDVLAAFTRE